MNAANEEEIDKILKGVEQLPPMPDVVLTLLEMIEDPEVSYIDLVKHLDVSLAAKILQVSNSAYYRTYRKIQNLEHAISILGIKTLKNILISIQISGFLAFESKNFDFSQFWRHSILTAYLARILARIIRYEDPEKLYTLGLIHDMGQIVIAQFLPVQFNKIIEKASTEGIGMTEAEILEIGISHAEVGAVMCEKWKMASGMVEVVRAHTKPENATDDLETFKVASIVNTAEYIANKLGENIDEGFNQKGEVLRRSILQLLQSTRTVHREQQVLEDWKILVETQTEKVENEIEEAMGFFSRCH